MRISTLFRRVHALFPALAVIVTTTLLVFMIVFTEFDVHWVTFLSGILIAASLALASRATKADWAVERHAAKLDSTHDTLAQEVKRREAAEAQLAAGSTRLQLIDNELPTMIAFVDRQGIYRYHNRAFREEMRLKAEQLNGAFMRDALGGKLYSEAAAHVRRALSGESVQFVSSRVGADGLSKDLDVRYLPSFTKKGTVDGFFEVQSAGPRGIAQAGAPDTRPGAPIAPQQPAGGPEQTLYVETFSEEVTGWSDAPDRIVAAIEKDEFTLLCQVIAPLAARASAVNNFEIFVRLMEEEDNLMPPGAFFPLAEKFGLLPRLDRWVVQHVVEWVSNRAPTPSWSSDSIFFINLASATVGDAAFPEFVEKQLSAYRVPGRALCFEVTELVAASERANVARFAAQIRPQGCLLALSGFGRESVSFDTLRDFKADFVKIDGSVVLGMLRNKVHFARMAAIARVAKAIGVRSVAELVESPEIVEKLREVGIDFAQGNGIATPVPLRELESRKA
jgi:EAL domain-containing protein (putative c-di-GMP-specific phosphodiesterase class I)/PAS domain-containing protein